MQCPYCSQTYGRQICVFNIGWPFCKLIFSSRAGLKLMFHSTGCGLKMQAGGYMEGHVRASAARICEYILREVIMFPLSYLSETLRGLGRHCIMQLL